MTVRATRTYLDYNASAPLLSEARDALIAALDEPGNASSVHGEGQAQRRQLERARSTIAALVNAGAEGVVFTSGATEAANFCLTPHWTRDGKPLSVAALAVCDTDHPATRGGGRFAADTVTRLPVDAAGRLVLDALEGWLAELAPSSTAMLCLSFANSETGVVQAIASLRERLEGRDVLLVLDAVQAAGRMPLDIGALGADALLLSGHKLGAAKGVGALVLSQASTRPLPLLTGGSQENGRRAGTEAVPLIASFAAAAELAMRRLDTEATRLAGLRHRLEDRLHAAGLEVVILGEGAERLPNTVAVFARGIKAETAQIALDLQGFAVSSGSACTSGKVGASDVLQAMQAGGLDIDPAAGAIRISFGYGTTEDEIDSVAKALLTLIERARSSEPAKPGGLRAA